MSGIFQDLRKQPRDRLDFLHATHEYGVLAVEDHQVHVDQPIHQDGVSHWTCADQAISPTVINEVTLGVGISCQAGDVLCQHQTIADDPTLHQRLLAKLGVQWNKSLQMFGNGSQRCLLPMSHGFSLLSRPSL